MIESISYIYRNEENGIEEKYHIPLDRINYIKERDSIIVLLMKNGPPLYVEDQEAIRKLKEIFKEKE